MNDDAIVFAMANPNPEVMPEDAGPHVRIMATGRSDYPNQINNVLCFPGIFRGALDAGAPAITEEMKLAAAKGVADVVADEDLSEDYIIPSVFNRDVAPAVAEAVVEEAEAPGSPASARRPAPSRHRCERRRHETGHRRQRCDRVGALRRAAARGDEVAGLSRDPEASLRTANPTVRWHAWEPTSERPPAEAFEQVDGVVNLVGEPIDQRWTDEAKQRIMDSRRTGTRNLVQAIAGARAQAEGAGEPIGDRLLRRSRRQPRRRVDSARARRLRRAGRRRMGASRARRHQASGVRLVIVRTGLVLDPESGLLKRLLPPFKLGVGGPLGRRRPVHVLDPHRRRDRRSCSGRSTTRLSTASSTPPPPTRSPTASSRRRSAARWGAPP